MPEDPSKKIRECRVCGSDETEVEFRPYHISICKECSIALAKERWRQNVNYTKKTNDHLTDFEAMKMTVKEWISHIESYYSFVESSDVLERLRIKSLEEAYRTGKATLVEEILYIRKKERI